MVHSLLDISTIQLLQKLLTFLKSSYHPT